MSHRPYLLPLEVHGPPATPAPAGYYRPAARPARTSRPASAAYLARYAAFNARLPTSPRL